MRIKRRLSETSETKNLRKLVITRAPSVSQLSTDLNDKVCPFCCLLCFGGCSTWRWTSRRWCSSWWHWQCSCGSYNCEFMSFISDHLRRFFPFYISLRQLHVFSIDTTTVQLEAHQTTMPGVPTFRLTEMGARYGCRTTVVMLKEQCVTRLCHL